MNKNNKIRKFHQAKWDEEIIFELDSPGERGILFREVEKEIVEVGELDPDQIHVSGVYVDTIVLIPEDGIFY